MKNQKFNDLLKDLKLHQSDLQMALDDCEEDEVSFNSQGERCVDEYAEFLVDQLECINTIINKHK
jgi:hypothetical protein